MYQTVVEDVINGVRETFLDEGMDEQVLMELKQVREIVHIVLVLTHGRVLYLNHLVLSANYSS